MALIILCGCAGMSQYGKLEKTARQKYKSGDFDGAVYDCVASLKLKPDYDKSQALLQEAFVAAVKRHEDNIARLEPSSDKFKWDEIVGEYDALIGLNKAVTSLPPLTDKKTKEPIKLDVRNYAQQYSQANEKAAESHYQEGLRLAQNPAVDAQKQAAKEFKKADEYSPGYKDAASLYQKSRQAGIKRMAIIPFDDRSGKRGQYGAIPDIIVDEVISTVLSDAGASEFLEIVSRDQLQRVLHEQQMGQSSMIDQATAVELGKVLGVHEILTGRITGIIYTPARTTEKNLKNTARVVVRTEKYVDDKGKTRERDVYGDVTAYFTTYTKTSSASVSGSYQIIDVKTAAVKKSDSFSKKSSFSHEWAVFTGGDERALPKEIRALASKTEAYAPVEDELVQQAARSLAKSLATSLIVYAR